MTIVSIERIVIMLSDVQKLLLAKLPHKSKFGRGEGAKLSSIAECANMSKSTTWRHLQKLVELGFVVREDLPYKKHFVSRYSLSPQGEFVMWG